MDLKTAIQILKTNGIYVRKVAKNHRQYKLGRHYLDDIIVEADEIIKEASYVQDRATNKKKDAPATRNVGKTIGYARVSSYGQSLDIQLEKLAGYPCDKIFQEKMSGVDRTRPELNKCLDYLREGDTLVVTKTDRLARSFNHFFTVIKRLEDEGIALKILDQSIDTSTPTGRLLLNILGVLAEFENEIRKERQMDGIKKARENGVHFGPKAKLTDEQVQEMATRKEAGAKVKDLMADYGISKDSVYRLTRPLLGK